MLKVGIWGCGGISAMHRRAYDFLERAGAGVKLVALCDINEKAFNSETKINISRGGEPLPVIEHCYTDIDKMLKEQSLDLVDICLPTFLHKDAAIKALGQNLNVLVEKPMAMSFAECAEILQAEKSSAGRLMVGHCVRFMEHYAFLNEIKRSGKYGRVISADFARLSPYPMWKYHKSSASTDGGVIFDLHIHDTDFAVQLFGMPRALHSVCTGKFSDCDSAATTFFYDNFYVNIRSDWALPQGFAFKSPYTVNFEKAAIEFDGTGQLLLYTDDGAQPLSTPAITHDYITAEISAFAKMLQTGAQNTVNPPSDSAKAVFLAEKIRESALSGRAVMCGLPAMP